MTTVTDTATKEGFTFADVYRDGSHIGRVVLVEPSGTWRPDAKLQAAVGAHTWASLSEAREQLEGETE